MAKNTNILERYAIVLEALAAAPDGMYLTEIANQTEIPQATAHRLVKALLKVGYVVQRDNRKIYVLGPRLLRLLYAGVPPMAVSLLSSQPLQALVTEFKETAFVAKLVGVRVESVAMVVPSGEVQSFVQPGRNMPINAAASAKAIFAFSDADVLEPALAEPLVKYQQNTHIDREAIISDLESVRRNGYAICEEELDPGVKSFACPIHTGGAGVICSVGIVGLLMRLQNFNDTHIVSELRTAANQISELLQSSQYGLTEIDDRVVATDLRGSY